ncbi:PBP/GOBP family domain-containing protein [Phthorimaea operculella]|nr:PBP/GOBP family domain-containing protein [Phthorimaea operculella]
MTVMPIAMAVARVKMSYKKYHVLLLFALILNCEALNCRSDGGPKEDELKTIYRNCLKKQNGKNFNQSRGYQSDDDWRDSKGHSQRSPWDKDDKFGDDETRDDGSYRDGMYGNERRNSYDRTSVSYDRGTGTGTSYDRTGTASYDRSGGSYDRTSGSYDRSGSSYDRTGGSYDRMGGSYDRMGDSDDRMSRNDGMGGRYGVMGSRNEGNGRSQVTGREDFMANDGFGEGVSPYNGYRSTTQASRRFKREKRIGTNSGHRSQYNPNTSNRPSYDDYRSDGNDERNNSNGNSSKNGDRKACAMHCFLENLEMTGDSGMPDRYLVTHVITKDVKNEDLRDFLQESIEECFQILDNENTEDKCEFSKNLLMCLSEKGRANCDDWKDDIQF